MPDTEQAAVFKISGADTLDVIARIGGVVEAHGCTVILTINPKYVGIVFAKVNNETGSFDEGGLHADLQSAFKAFRIEASTAQAMNAAMRPAI